VGQSTRDLYATRLRRRRFARRAFDVFIIIAFWAAVIYLAVS
jgi:hypothetical protein